MHTLRLVLLATLLSAGHAFVTLTPRTTFTRSTTTSSLGASSGSMGCRPIGIGSAAPKTGISNSDLESVVETTADWIESRTGIGERRVLLQEEGLRSLSVAAAKQALEMAGCEASDLGMVIFATSSPDDLFGDAPSIASALGCDKGTLAFDLTAACSGFLFATVTAGKFLAGTPDGSKALVIGGDALSRWVDWDDRNTCILFGDGAGAMILESTSEAPGILGYAAHSNGLGSPDLYLG